VPTAHPTATVGGTDGWGTKVGDKDLWGNIVTKTTYPTEAPTGFPTARPTESPTLKPTAFPTAYVRDCVGFWGQWQKCSKMCGGGTQTRSYNVQSKEQNGGKPCPGYVPEDRVCNTQKCAKGTVYNH